MMVGRVVETKRGRIRHGRCTNARLSTGIISHCVWLYYSFTLSLRDVAELMLARGIVVSHETIRTGGTKFGPEYARILRRRAPRPGDTWFLDEVFVKIGGLRKYLWRAVDQSGNVLDVLPSKRIAHGTVKLIDSVLSSNHTSLNNHTRSGGSRAWIDQRQCSIT